MPFFRLHATLLPDCALPDDTGVLLWAADRAVFDVVLSAFTSKYASVTDGKLAWDLESLIRDMPEVLQEFEIESPHLARDPATYNEYNLPIWKFFVATLKRGTVCEVHDPKLEKVLRVVLSFVT